MKKKCLICKTTINSGKSLVCNKCTKEYEGRHQQTLYRNDEFNMIGWNMYLTPEQAAKGLELFEKIKEYNEDQDSSKTCKDLSKFKIYEKANR